MGRRIKQSEAALSIERTLETAKHISPHLSTGVRRPGRWPPSVVVLGVVGIVCLSAVLALACLKRSGRVHGFVRAGRVEAGVDIE